jgi:hypothetical protein
VFIVKIAWNRQLHLVGKVVFIFAAGSTHNYDWKKGFHKFMYFPFENLVEMRE